MSAWGELIGGSEAWIVERVLRYAEQHGFARHTTPHRMDWNASVAGLSATIAQTLAAGPRALEMRPDADHASEAASDSISGPSQLFALDLARRHRARGVSLGMFLGLLSYFRQSYLDLVEQASLAPEEKTAAQHFLTRLFDRIATDVAVEWTGVGEAEVVGELRRQNLSAIGEKNRYLTVFESLPDPAVFLDLAGTVLDMNTACARWLGPEARAAVGRRVVELMPWLDPELGVMLADAKGADVLAYARNVARQGGTCSLDIRLVALRDSAGGLTGLLALMVDVTTLRAAQEAQAASEAKLREKVLEVTCLNELAEMLSTPDLPLDELLLRTAQVLPRGWLRPQDVVAHISLDGRTLPPEAAMPEGVLPEGEGPGGPCLRQNLELFGQKRGEARVCFAAHAGAAAFTEGQNELLAGSVRQLERALEARLSREVLGQSEKLFREFFDNAADAIFIHDETGLVLDANRNAGIWLSTPTEALRGASLTDWLAEADREAVLGRFRDVLHDNTALFQVTLLRRDGFPLPLEILSQRMHYQGRLALVSSCRNVAARLRTYAEIEFRLAQEELLASISGQIINSPGPDLPMAIQASLGEVCRFLGMGRAGVYLATADAVKHKEHFELAHQWSAEGSPEIPKALQRISRAKMPWLMERIQAGERVFVREARHMPPTGRKEREQLMKAGLASLVALPMVVNTRLMGVLAVASDAPQDPARLSGSPLLDQVALLLSNALEKRRINAALRESESLSRSILDSLQAFLCVVDKRGTLTMVNRVWESQGAASGPEVAARLGVGGNYLEFCRAGAEAGDEDCRKILAGIRNVLSGRSKDYRLEYPSHQGASTQWFMLQATPRGRSLRGAVLSHVNITGRVRAEQRLRKNEARYRSLVEAMHEGLLLVRKTGRITFVNDQFASMLGRPKAEIAGRLAEEFAAAGSVSRLRELLSGRAQDAGAEEILWNHASGRHIYTLLSPSAALDEDGAVTGTFAVVTDTTERKSLESQLLHSQKLEAIGQLAAGIAHEINTPAQYVGNNVQFIKGAFEDVLAVCQGTKGFLERWKTACPGQEDLASLEKLMDERDVDYLATEVPGAIAQTLEGVERISTIVRSVKQFAHPGAAVMAPADLNESMKSTVTVSRNEWKYVAELDTDLDPSLPLVSCMIGEINQVVLNLIINAAHAIADAQKKEPGRAGRITLSTRRNAPWAEIRVADTGTGIPPAVQARIFDPFFTTKEVGRGTGQGLTISRSIVVDKHGGQLFFETEPGAGTSFVVRLPLEQPNEGREK